MKMHQKGINGDDMIPSQNISDSAIEYVRDGWLLAAPAYEDGTLSTRLYDAGTGLSPDRNGVHTERSYMMCISSTEKLEFHAYLTKLTNCGYVLDSENTLAAPSKNGFDAQTNLYRQYRKGNQLLYVYFNESVGEARIIDDHASVAESEFEYTFDFDASTSAEIYMYGMKYHPQGINFCDAGGDPDTCNNGSFFIIKQADNSVILIDGGAQRQVTDAAVEGLWSFMHTITGKGTDEAITVACWIHTHPHEDHYALVWGLLERYHAKIDLQRVMFNFPNPSEVGIGIYEFRGGVADYYPNVLFAKCHSGQSIQLGSIVLDVLTTHEDMVSAVTGVTRMTEGNSMSTVIRFTMPDGTRFLNLGDFTREQQFVLIDGKDANQIAVEGILDSAELRSDIVEVAHHGYNMITNTYQATGAEHALWSNYQPDAFTGWKKDTADAIKDRLMKRANVSEGNIYYAGLNTVKLTCQNGNITVTLSNPVF